MQLGANKQNRHRFDKKIKFTWVSALSAQVALVHFVALGSLTALILSLFIISSNGYLTELNWHYVSSSDDNS